MRQWFFLKLTTWLPCEISSPYYIAGTSTGSLIIGEKQPEVGIGRIYGQKLQMGSQPAREAVSVTEAIPEATAKFT